MSDWRLLLTRPAEESQILAATLAEHGVFSSMGIAGRVCLRIPIISGHKPRCRPAKVSAPHTPKA